MIFFAVRLRLGAPFVKVPRSLIFIAFYFFVVVHFLENQCFGSFLPALTS